MFVVRLFLSSKSGKPCNALVAKLGYRDLILSWDSNICAELLGISRVDLAARLDKVLETKQDVELPVRGVSK